MERLIGVVVPGFRGSGISFIIPTRHLSLMLQGRLGKPQLTSSRDDDGQLVIHVEIPLIDPLKKIQSVALYYMSPSLADKPPQPSAQLAQLKGVSKLPLEIKDQVASGKFSPHKGATEFKLLYQASCTTSDGKEGLSKNMTQTIGLSPAHVPANQGDEPTPVGPAHHDTPGAKETRIMGGAVGKRFSDEAPPGGVLIGFEVGLGKLDENDVVHTIRPIFRIANGREVLGEQHGTDTSRLIVVKAKKGYAVGGITAKFDDPLVRLLRNLHEGRQEGPGSPGSLPERLGGRQGRRSADPAGRRRPVGDWHRRPRKGRHLHRNGATAETVRRGGKPKQRRPPP